MKSTYSICLEAPTCNLLQTRLAAYRAMQGMSIHSFFDSFLRLLQAPQTHFRGFLSWTAHRSDSPAQTPCLRAVAVRKAVRKDVSGLLLRSIRVQRPQPPLEFLEQQHDLAGAIAVATV